MALFEQISEDIQKAMKARDKVRLETLRNIKKVFLMMRFMLTLRIMLLTWLLMIS